VLEHCVKVEGSVFLKDLSLLGRLWEGIQILIVLWLHVEGDNDRLASFSIAFDLYMATHLLHYKLTGT